MCRLGVVTLLPICLIVLILNMVFVAVTSFTYFMFGSFLLYPECLCFSILLRLSVLLGCRKQNRTPMAHARSDSFFAREHLAN